MSIPLLQKWQNTDDTEGLLFFAQALTEMLEDNSLDSYKAPALNLHLAFWELATMLKLFVEGRVRKGALSFSLEECNHRISKDIIFADHKKRLFSKYLSQITEAIENKNEDNINKNILLSIASAATADLTDSYWESLKNKLLSACSDGYQKKTILHLTLEFATELGNLGFSKQYILAKTRKFFFSTNAAPETITNNDQISDFIDIFEVESQNWEVCFIGNATGKSALTHMKRFGIKKIIKRPKRFARNPKFTKFLKSKTKGSIVYSINDRPAKDPHKARARAEAQLNFYTDVCRFHKHDAVFEFKDTAFVYSLKTKEAYNIPRPPKPMECGATFRNAENEEAIENTLEILSGSHFSINSIRDFHKVLDFHHAAMTSTDHENQLLDLWAALEGFLPAPDRNSDRIEWYLHYTLPPLSMRYNEKMFQSISANLSCEQENIVQLVEEVGEADDFFLKTIHLVTSADQQVRRTELLGQLGHNPLLRNRIDRLSKDYRKTDRIRKAIKSHKEKLAWHIQRIYTLRNQIAHNASSLPYIRNLVENLHDYLDTIILAVSSIGRDSKVTIDVHTALEKIATIESDYIDSLTGSTRLDSSNCLKLVLGENNILSKYHNTL